MPTVRTPVISFAVGSFFFAPDGPFPYDFTGRDHMNRIRAALEHLANVNEVELEYSPEFDDKQMILTEALPVIGERLDYSPSPTYMTLDFRLDLPMRLQQELSPWRFVGQPVDTKTEHFHVSIRQKFHASVAFITLIDPGRSPSPSTAVAILREFLTKAFADTEHLRFDCLGPSPFHADFFIRPSRQADEERPFTCLRTTREGYDRITYRYNGADFDTIDEARDHIFDAIDNAFDFVYHLQQVEAHDLVQFDEITDLVTLLVELEKEKGLTGFWKRFRSTSVRSDALMKLADFEAEQVYRQVPTMRTYRQITRQEDAACILSDIDELTQRPMRWPVEQTERLLQLFERRRSSALQNIVTSIAGLVGVGIGALLTALFT